MNLSRTNMDGLCTCGGAYGLLLTNDNEEEDKNLNYCHYLNEFHRNNCASLNSGHYQSWNWKDSVNWSDSHKSNCCCKGRVDSTPHDSVQNPI